MPWLTPSVALLKGVVGGSRWKHLFLLSLFSIAVAGPFVLQEPKPDSGSVLLGRHEHWSRALAFSPDGTALAAGGGLVDRKDELLLWDLASGRPRVLQLGDKPSIDEVAYSPDGKWLVLAQRDRTIGLVNAANGREEVCFAATFPWPQSFAFTEDSKELLMPNGDGSFAVWDIARKRLRIEPLPTRGQWLAYARGKVVLATDKTSGAIAIAVCDLSSQKELVHLQVPASQIWVGALSPDGLTLALGTEEDGIYFCDLPSGRIWSSRQQDEERINCLAFSPDGRTLASGSQDRSVRLWDVATGEPLGILGKHEGAVFAVAFAPDGRRVASGGFDKLVRVWQAPVDLGKADLLTAGR